MIPGERIKKFHFGLDKAHWTRVKMLVAANTADTMRLHIDSTEQEVL